MLWETEVGCTSLFMHYELNIIVVANWGALVQPESVSGHDSDQQGGKNKNFLSNI